MKNYRSTIGGSVSALGTFMFAAPMVFVSTQYECPKTVIICFMVAGFILQGLGQFFSSLFAADAKDVHALKQEVKTNTEFLAKSK